MRLRHTRPVPRRGATGLTAEVYTRSTAEFGQPALAMLAPATAVHAAAWSLLREAELAGPADRVDREVVALAVSRANRCRFCLDAHTVLLHALGASRLAEDLRQGRVPADARLAALAAWAAGAAAAGRPGQGTPSRAGGPVQEAGGSWARGGSPAGGPPFPAAQASWYVGTAVSTHFVNRLFGALTDERLLPGDLQRSSAVRRAAGLAHGPTARRRLEPGASLALLAGLPADSPPAWAGDTAVATAVAALSAATAPAAEALGPGGRALLASSVAAGRPRDARVLLAGSPANLDPAERAATRLAVLAATAPHELTDADVAAWRAACGGDDAQLVRLLAHGAFAAATHAGQVLAGAAARV